MSKISELSDGGAIQSGDTLIAVRSGGNVKVTYGGTTTANIDGGTIDGTVIGGSSAAAGTFTSITGTSANINGTVTADGLTVDGNATIGSGGSGAANVTIALNGSDAGTHGTVIQGKRNGTNQYILGDISGIIGSGNGMASWVYNSNPYYVYTGNTKSLEIAGNGNLSLYEDTGTTAKFFWDASAESLEVAGNIITTTGLLRVNGGTGDGNATAPHYSFNTDTDIGMFRAGVNNLGFATTGVERIRVDQNGNVGIGTSSPSSNADIVGSTGLRISSDKSTSSMFILSADASETRITSTSYGSFQPLTVHTGGSERMRIDSSGSLLVGTTTLNVYNGTTTGVAFTQGGYIFAGKSGDAPLYLNRITNDGDIVVFHKDGTAVGSIGSFSGVTYIGCATGGLMFNGLNLNPTGAGSTRTDGTNDIGSPTYRFKDLYLSGEAKITSSGVDGTYSPILRGIYSGNSNETNTIETAVSSDGSLSGFKFNVSNGGGSSGQTEALRVTRAGTYAPAGIYLGGTGAANLLDDYEEGTWTPTVYGTTTTGTASYTQRVGTYTKVGNLAYVQAYVIFNSFTGGGEIRISGLPFTPESGAYENHVGSMIVVNMPLPSNTIQINPRAIDGQTYIDIQATLDNAGYTPLLTDTAGEMIISVTYRTA